MEQELGEWDDEELEQLAEVEQEIEPLAGVEQELWEWDVEELERLAEAEWELSGWLRLSRSLGSGVMGSLCSWLGLSRSLCGWLG